MFLDLPPDNGDFDNHIRKKISIRVPKELWLKMQEKAKHDYSGRGKQAQLVSDAVRHFLKNINFESINWEAPDEDYDFINLATQIRQGASMKNLNKEPVKTFIDADLLEKLMDLDAKVKGARKMLDIHIKPAIIRRALSEWMYADKAFLKIIHGGN